jgi:hypothetical protein
VSSWNYKLLSDNPLIGLYPSGEDTFERQTVAQSCFCGNEKRMFSEFSDRDVRRDFTVLWVHRNRSVPLSH